MEKFSTGVIRQRRGILLITLLLCVISVFLMQTVKVNYDLAGYLPMDAPSTRALHLVTARIPNLQVYLPGLEISQVRAAKEQLSAIPGVEEVLWMDDAQPAIIKPLEMIPDAIRNPFYQDGPMFQVVVAEEAQSDTVPLIREAFPGVLLKGQAADTAQTVNTTMSEVASIMIYILPIVLLILFIATTHWLEPALFLLAIGAAILVNEGSNVVLGSVSFVTRAASAVLQLAVSIDYAIFLLHRFSDNREEGLPVDEAMKLAMQQAVSSIASSAMTTVFGFLALMLMRFEIGQDMGIVLAKGVMLSFLSVMIVLPAATVSLSGLMDKTRHRPFVPSFKGFSRFVTRRLPALAIVFMLVLPLAFLAQRNNEFVYGSGGMHSPDSPIRLEQKALEERFGQSRMMLVLVPSGDPVREAALGEELAGLDQVESLVSYASSVGVQVPAGTLPQGVRDQFMDGGYSRMILAVSTPDEGPEAFRLVEQARALGEAYYPGEAHVLGESVVNLDLKTVITGDNLPVLLAGIIAIGLVLLVNFKNLLIPLILLIIIEGAIWINMAVPFVLGESMNYIGYQIVSSVQLGATVDYGILLVQRYLEGRQTMDRKAAAAWALEVSTGSILPPAMILTSAGYLLGFLVRENGIISQMGFIIGSGAAISCGLVLLVLPTLLIWLDKPITSKFLKKRKEPIHETNLP
ncbi:MAG: MMPL family transporter [Eubacteriales bacterium]|nr:MMPL family transporter [Eubacteriales bacterium]